MFCSLGLVVFDKPKVNHNKSCVENLAILFNKVNIYIKLGEIKCAHHQLFLKAVILVIDRFRYIEIQLRSEA